MSDLIKRLKRAARVRGPQSKSYNDTHLQWYCDQCKCMLSFEAFAPPEEIERQIREHKESYWCSEDSVRRQADREKWMPVHGRYLRWFDSIGIRYHTYTDYIKRRTYRYKAPQWVWAIVMIGQKQVTAGRRRRLLERVYNNTDVREEFEARMRLILDYMDPDQKAGSRSWAKIVDLIEMIAGRVGMTYPKAKIMKAHDYEYEQD